MSYVACNGQDGTIVATQAAATLNEFNFKFFSKNVAKKLQALHKDGYKIVVFRFKTVPLCSIVARDNFVCGDICVLAAIRTA